MCAFIKPCHTNELPEEAKKLRWLCDDRGRTLIADNDINDFFDHLVFAVNQPNEVELDAIITPQLSKQFNLIDNSFIYHEFQGAVLNWMKKKEGTFLTEGDMQSFLTHIDESMSNFALIGPTTIMKQKLATFGISYQPSSELRAFLDNSGKQFFIYYSNQYDSLSLRLINARVYHTLKNHPDYSKQNAYTMISMKNALRLGKTFIHHLPQTRLLVLMGCGVNDGGYALINAICHEAKPRKVIFIADHKLHLPGINQCVLDTIKEKWDEEGHQRSAMKLLFPQYPLKAGETAPLPSAMLTFFNDSSSFTRHKLAEYFAAQFFIDELQKPNSEKRGINEVLIREIFKNRYSGVKRHIDEFFAYNQENKRALYAWHHILHCNLSASYPFDEACLKLVAEQSPESYKAWCQEIEKEIDGVNKDINISCNPCFWYEEHEVFAGDWLAILPHITDKGRKCEAIKILETTELAFTGSISSTEEESESEAENSKTLWSNINASAHYYHHAYKDAYKDAYKEIELPTSTITKLDSEVSFRMWHSFMNYIVAYIECADKKPENERKIIWGMIEDIVDSKEIEQCVFEHRSYMERKFPKTLKEKTALPDNPIFVLEQKVRLLVSLKRIWLDHHPELFVVDQKDVGDKIDKYLDELLTKMGNKEKRANIMPILQEYGKFTPEIGKEFAPTAHDSDEYCDTMLGYLMDLLREPGIFDKPIDQPTLFSVFYSLASSSWRRDDTDEIKNLKCTPTALKNLLTLIENVAKGTNYLPKCADLLYLLSQMGLILIDLGSHLGVELDDGDIKFISYRFNFEKEHHQLMCQLLRLRDNDPDDTEFL